MKVLSLYRVAAIVVILGAAIVFLVVYMNRESDLARDTYRQLTALEARAKERFAESRGLAPCDYEERRWLLAAERKLTLAGKSSSRALIVIAPTFSDIDLLALSSTGLDRYTFPGQTAFAWDFIEHDQVKPRTLPPIRLPQHGYERLIAAVSRNSEYAMSSRESGHDGVSYYFGSSANHCAMAWSPTEGSISAQLAEVADLLTENQPSIAAIEHALKILEARESAH